MSSSTDSSSSYLEAKKRNVFREIVKFSVIVPYDEDLEPLPTPEEAEEAKTERLYQARFTQLVELDYKAYDSQAFLFK